MLVGGFSVFTTLFLWVYQPFGAQFITGNRFLFLAGFDAMVAIGLSISYLFLPAVFPKLFQPDSWSIGRELGFVTFSVVEIALFNFVYISTAGADIAPQNSFPAFVGITFSVGFFPLLALIFVTERFLRTVNAARGEQLERTIKENRTEDAAEPVFIQPDA